jgi:hypothetical protein
MLYEIGEYLEYLRFEWHQLSGATQLVALGIKGKIVKSIQHLLTSCHTDEMPTGT